MKAGLFIVILMSGLVFNCTDSQKKKQTIVVYSAHGHDIGDDIRKGFEAKYPGIKLEWVDGGAAALADKVKGEKDAPQADILWGGGADLFGILAEEGVLMPYKPTWADQVIAAEKDPQDRWYGHFRMIQGIGFNGNVLTRDKAPQEWDGLLKPAWKKKIVLRYPPPSGTMGTIFGAMILRQYNEKEKDKPGLAWLKKLHQQTRDYAAKPEIMYSELNANEPLVTLWNITDLVYQSRIKKRFNFNFVLPKSGVPIASDNIAIVKGCQNPEGAKKFYEYATSLETGKMLIEKHARILCRKDAAQITPEWLKGVTINPMPLDWELLKQKKKEWMKYWETKIKGS